MIKVQIIGYSPCSSYYVGNDREGYLVDCPTIGDLEIVSFGLLTYNSVGLS